MDRIARAARTFRMTPILIAALLNIDEKDILENINRADSLLIRHEKRLF